MRVLVAEDHYTIRTNLTRLLEELGQEVVAVADGHAAWEEVDRGGGFSTVISDLQMPILDGLELLARMRAERRHKKTDFILTTATTLTPLQHEILSRHNGQLIQKPYDYSLLVRALGLDRRASDK